jgi:hypothetical protein
MTMTKKRRSQRRSISHAIEPRVTGSKRLWLNGGAGTSGQRGNCDSSEDLVVGPASCGTEQGSVRL